MFRCFGLVVISLIHSVYLIYAEQSQQQQNKNVPVLTGVIDQYNNDIFNSLTNPPYNKQIAPQENRNTFVYK